MSVRIVRLINHVIIANLKPTRMDKCKWNYKILGHHVRLTEADVFIILGQRQEQWREIVRFKIRRIMVTFKDNKNEYHHKPLSEYLRYKFNGL